MRHREAPGLPLEHRVYFLIIRGLSAELPMWVDEAGRSCRYGASLLAQWLRFHVPNAGGPSSIPGQGTRSHIRQVIVHMLQLKTPQPTETYCIAQGTLHNVMRQPGWEQFEGEWIHVYVCLSPFTVHLKLSQHC